MSSSAYRKTPKFLRRTIPEGRIVMVSKRGWAGLPGFGCRHPNQTTRLKEQHPGVVLKNAKAHLPVLEVLPGTSSKPWQGGGFFCPSDDPIPALDSEAVKRGYFLLSEWRTVRRNTKSIKRHLADLTSTDLVRLRLAMTRKHGGIWKTSSPNAGPR